MNARQLIEGAVVNTIAYVQTNLPAALDLVNSDAITPKVSLENPKSYFIYPKAKGYEAPAVFVVCDDQDFRINDKKSNFINASDKINVSVVIEDQDEDLLTYKAWRYQRALHIVLDEATIVSTDQSLVLKSVVYHTRISQTYGSDEVPGGHFRKEVVLFCEVDHLENF